MSHTHDKRNVHGCDVYFLSQSIGHRGLKLVQVLWHKSNCWTNIFVTCIIDVFDPFDPSLTIDKGTDFFYLKSLASCCKLF